MKAIKSKKRAPHFLGEPDLRYDQIWAIGLTVFYLILTTTRAFDFWKGNSVAEAYANSWKGNILISLLGNLVLLVTIPFLIKRYQRVKEKLVQNWPLVILFGYTLISCLWSEFPDIAFRRWMKIFIYFLLLLNLFSLPKPIPLLRKTFLLYIYIVSTLSFVMIFISRKYGWQPYEGGELPCGIMGHKIGFGLFCAASFFTMLWYSSSGHIPFKAQIKKHAILYALLLAGLISSGAMTAVGGLLLASALSLLVYVIMRLRGPYIAAAILLFIIVGILFVFIVNENTAQANLLEFVLKPTGKDPTFTGRTDIWSAAISFGLKNKPIFGSGFGTLFLGDKSSWLQSVFGWAVWGSHSAYIETFLETGLIGLAILVLIILDILVHIFEAVYKYKRHSVALLSLVILIIFINFFNMDLLNPTFAFFLLLFLSFYKSMSVPPKKCSAPAAG
jgi:exopolysaccharide production protein ExoQ